MNKKLLGAAALMAMAAVMAAGCGGGDKKPAAPAADAKKARQEKLAFTLLFIRISWINSVNPMSPRLSRA